MKTKSDIQIPSTYTGSIITLPVASICNDNVKHGIVVSGEPTIIRIKGRTPQAQKEIERWADSNSFVPISVTGYTVKGPECSYLSVFHVGPTEELVSLLGGELEDT